MTRSFNSAKEWLGEPGPKRNIRMGLLALVLLDVLFYLFAIGPLSESDREKRLLADNLGRQVKERTTQVEKLAAVVKKVEAARTDGDKLLDEITMPRRTAYSTILSEIDEAGKKAGIELRDRGYNVEAIEGSDTLSMMTVTAGLEGEYENLVRFLNQLDRSARFLIIESLQAAPQQSGAKLNVTLKLDVFVRESS